MAKGIVVLASVFFLFGCSKDMDGETFVESCFDRGKYSFECDGTVFKNLEGIIETANEASLIVKVGKEMFTLEYPQGYEKFTDIDLKYLQHLPISFSGTIHEEAWVSRTFSVSGAAIKSLPFPDKAHMADIDEELAAKKSMLDARGGEYEAFKYCIAQAESFYHADCGFDDDNYKSVWSDDTLITTVHCKNEIGHDAFFECRTFDDSTFLDAYW